MKVKIGDTYYDSRDVPIMVVFTDFDKANVSQMRAADRRYAAYRKSHFQGGKEQAQKWMLDKIKIMDQ